MAREDSVVSYTIVDKLHQGKRTAVYRGVRDADQLPVVLKVLDASVSGPREVERLQHEYELGKEITSPAVLKPLAFEAVDGKPTLVMEDVGGDSLDHMLTPGEPMALERFLPLALSLTRALAAFHDMKLVHRDIKPENFIIVPSTGEVRIADLGLASRIPREQAAARPPRLIEGTLPYISPEQTGRVNSPVDSRSDLYSLGVTLFQMLTGRLPFTADGPLGWVHCHIARPPPVPHELVASLPRQLSDILLRLLAKAPEERYQSARGLEHDLDRCLQAWRADHDIAPFALGERDWSGRLSPPRTLYGRDAETRELRAAFDRVASTSALEFVLVSGYAGIGKSSLVRQLHIPVVTKRGHFVSGKFDQYKREVPHLPLLQACRELLLELLAESEEQVAAVRRALDDRLGANAGLLVQMLPELERVVGPKPPAPEVSLADAENRLHLTFERFLGVFASKQHPLAIFLDDLQWADSASLHLLERLVTGGDVPYLLLLGAYRDNEVDASHPLPQMLARCREHGTMVHDLKLHRLSPEHIIQLLDEMLRGSSQDNAHLAQLVYAKTAGNPFFAFHFLATLEGQGLLTFSHADGRWHWDAQAIATEQVTDNVVDLLTSRVQRLPTAAQELTKLCACLGNVVDLATLMAVTGYEARHIDSAMQPALEQDLLVNSGEVLRFVHDRIQEAAYSLIPEHQRPATHLRIGQMLLERTTHDGLDAAIFDIVNHLNRGATLIHEQRDRDHLAELNLRAGRRAQSAAAFATSVTYFDTGASLLAPDAWDSHHDLCFDLRSAAAACALAIGHVDDTRRRIADIRAGRLSRRELGEVTCLETELWLHAFDYSQAVAASLEYLKEFDIHWSMHPSHDMALSEYDGLRRHLGRRAIAECAAVPSTTDPDVIAIMQVLASLAAATLFVDINLQALVASRMVALTICRGHTEASVFGYASLAMATATPSFRQFRDAGEWASLALRLVDQPTSSKYKAQALVAIANANGAGWPPRHFMTVVDLATVAFDAAVKSGSLNYAGYARCLELWARLLLGTNLREVARGIRELRTFCQGGALPFLRPFPEYVQGLVRGLGGSRLSAPASGGAALLDSDLPADVAGTFRLWHCVLQLETDYIVGEYDAALKEAEEAEELLERVFACYAEATLPYFHALTLAARLDANAPQDPMSGVAKLRALHVQLTELAAQSEYYMHEHALVAAELARVDGYPEVATERYEQAIRRAREHGFVHHEAIAWEVASRFYRARGFTLIADSYLREARACYVRWGADEKVRELDRHHANLLGSRPVKATATFAALTEHLDLLSIIKASQTISGIIDENQLLCTLLRTVLEQGGGRVARVVFVRGDELTLEAEASVSEQGIQTALVGSLPVSKSAYLPESMLRYAQRTKERVLLDDMRTNGGEVAQDAYLARVRPRSALCVPIQREAEVIALLYLENDSVPGAFTNERLVALELLAAQAAISIDNALLLRRERAAKAEARFLANASKTLAESLDYGVTLEHLARLSVPFLADWCVVDVLEDGRTRRVAGAHVDPAKRPLLLELEKYDFADRPAGKAIEMGKTVLVADVTEAAIREATKPDTPHAEIVRALNPLSVVAVPLISQGQTLGAMTFASTRAELRYGPDEVALAEEVGRRASLAIEHARLYRGAQEAVRLRDQFIAVASHELRTPLTSLGLNVQVLGRTAARVTPEKLQRSCATLEQQIKRLGGLVEVMLDIGRIQRGQVELRLTDVDLVAVIGAALEKEATALSQARCTVDLHAPASVIGRWDRDRLEYAITCILSNALKFGSEKPIEIRVDVVDGRVTLAVTDHGIGIAADALPHIFDKFFRAVSLQSYGGFGLGLYMVRHIVEALGGSVRVESVLGSFTTITVELPLSGGGRDVRRGALPT
jgi:predicted ATPase/signal transduction histidine kinase/tRNA A-37 threonylcarbamoyl transferase component Bud32